MSSDEGPRPPRAARAEEASLIQTGDLDSLLATGQAALEAGRWGAARDAFTAALAGEESPEGLFGLGEALWWLGDTDAAIRLEARAYAGFRRRPDPVPAAIAAMNLYYFHRMMLGNVAASRGWLARMTRLVEGFGLTPLRGWELLLRATDRGEADPAAGEPMAREALELARRSGDLDLELCALSQIGGMLVELGRIEEGFALIDDTTCTMITSCARAAQFPRAAEWIRVGDDFVGRYGSAHVFTVCRLHLGGILFATGRWAEAESQLGDAIQAARTAEPALFAEALAKLAELRLARGRLEEARGLLAGFEDRPSCAQVPGAIHLARGEPALAAAILRRCLRAAGSRCLDSAVVVELLGEAEAALGGSRTARTRARRLAELGASLGCDLVVARAERALARAVAERDPAAAMPHLERALDAFGRLGMPLETGRTHLLIARALGEREREGAIAEARAAFAAFESLGATRDADAAAAFLRSLGARSARGGSRGVGLLTRREREVLELLGAGMPNRDMAARLFLTRKTVEHHVRSVLAKLGLTNRAEAAAYAVRHLGRGSATVWGFCPMPAHAPTTSIAPQGRQPSRSSPREPEMPNAATIQREMLSAVERKDLAGVRELLHPEYVYMASDGVERAGADAGVAVAELYLTAFPDLSFEVRASHAPSDEVAILELIGRGTHTGPLDGAPATGRRAEVSTCNVVETRDGKIYREREYFDSLSLLRQLGVSEG